MSDPIEEMLKEALEGRRTAVPGPTGDCPKETVLWDYLNGSLGKMTEEGIARHLLRCDFCLDALLLAQEVRPGIGFGPSTTPPSELLARAVSLGKGGKSSKSRIRKHLWLFLALFLIGLSFFLPRYFLQCLILGVIFGLKWVFDTATNRTLIVMVDALRKRHREEGTESRFEMKDRKE